MGGVRGRVVTRRGVVMCCGGTVAGCVGGWRDKGVEGWDGWMDEWKIGVETLELTSPPHAICMTFWPSSLSNVMNWAWYGCPRSFLGKSCGSPRPSWPWKLRPQINTSPDVVSAALWPHPATTCGDGGGSGGVGVRQGRGTRCQMCMCIVNF